MPSHLDTSPETTGAGVKPQVIQDYPGGDIVLPGDPSRVIRVADNPELDSLCGRTLITSDGTTLLGADDKAGVAIIMEKAAWLIEHPEISHGPVRICFTCDEEIGRGVDKLDLQEIGAAVCYTLDGHGSDEIDVETFSADQAVVTVRGVNIHPSIGKGRMTNAVRAAADFVARLPRDGLSPETTDGREGFLHPYDDGGRSGGSEAEDSAPRFRRRRAGGPGRSFAGDCRRGDAGFSGGEDRRGHRAAVSQHGRRACPRAARGGVCRRSIASIGPHGEANDRSRRHGWLAIDGVGLPTPNLSCGGHNPHSPLEWACLEEMAESVEWLVSLVRSVGKSRRRVAHPEQRRAWWEVAGPY